LQGSFCGIYDAGVNGCVLHDGLMQYEAIFLNVSTYFIFSRYIYLTQTSLRTQATFKAKSQVEAGSEVCHPGCVFKTNGKVNSVRKDNYNCMLDDGIY